MLEERRKKAASCEQNIGVCYSGCVEGTAAEGRCAYGEEGVSVCVWRLGSAFLSDDCRDDRSEGREHCMVCIHVSRAE